MKHMFAVHQILLPFTIYHNLEERVNIPLLQAATLCFAVIMVGNIPHLHSSMQAKEIEVISPLYYLLALFSVVVHILSWFAKVNLSELQQLNEI